MIKCRVEMWGLPREVAGVAELDIELADKAGLGDVVAALRRQVPALDGIVIREGEDRLEDTVVFNIDGQFIQEDDKIQLKNGDTLRLLTLATGG